MLVKSKGIPSPKSLNSGLGIISNLPDLDGTQFTSECATVGFNHTDCLTGDCGTVRGC